jgi:hypothetical protein
MEPKGVPTGKSLRVPLFRYAGLATPRVGRIRLGLGCDMPVGASGAASATRSSPPSFGRTKRSDGPRGGDDCGLSPLRPF